MSYRPLPDGVTIKRSPIEGLGLYATQDIPANTFIKVIDKISKIKNCKFFLATGKNEEEQVILRDILSSEFSGICKPLDDFSLREIMPLIKNCNLSICNDTSFSHLSAALGVKTITLMADTPLIYGNYSSKMFPIIPDGEETVSHNTCLLYTSPSPRDRQKSRMPSSA